MQRILDFLLAFKEYLALMLYVTLSLIMIAVSKGSDVQPLRAFTTGVVGAIQSTYAWIPNPVTMARENKELRDRNMELSSEVGRLRRSKVENDELRKLLGIENRRQWSLLPAEVVGKTTNFQRNMMTLSVGRNNGVLPGMAVVTDAGLVGKVYSTSNNFSLVEMLFNQDFRAASKIARTRVEGIIAWEGGPTVEVKNIPKALDVKAGDLVVTSEYSTFFPSDIPIGTVIRVEPEANTLFRKVSVDPSVNMFRVEHVYVVMKDVVMEKQRLELERQAQEEASTTVKK